MREMSDQYTLFRKTGAAADLMQCSVPHLEQYKYNRFECMACFRSDPFQRLEDGCSSRVERGKLATGQNAEGGRRH